MSPLPALLKHAAKSITFGVATALVLPQIVSYRLRSVLLGRDRALEGSTQLLGMIPGVSGQYLRRAFLAQVLKRCHPSATIEFGTIFSKADAEIDENVYVGPGCYLGLVHLESDVMLAGGVHVPSGGRTHGIADPTLPMRAQPGTRALVTIGRGAWVASAAVVLADVGADTVVGAGAVVTKALPAHVVAGGVPARVLRSRIFSDADDAPRQVG